jgi:methyltransferase (TIGR00027 family)
MKSGQESQTAIMVCMARAVAHERIPTVPFSDPTALVLLPEEARARVERFLADRAQRRRPTFRDVIMEKRSRMMVARTVEIDTALRNHPAPQVVILGAGLDGRAWRMPELRDSVVFEVDHPDSQRAKRERVAALRWTAREVRFVPVDFTRESLEEKLAAAGHDPRRATTWIWEGVVMYLTPKEVEATLAGLARRSAPGSSLVVAYHRNKLLTLVIAPLFKRLSEPLRSSFSPRQMGELLARHGFQVSRDLDVPAIAQLLSPELGRETRPLKHLRIATAERSLSAGRAAPS